MNMSQNLLMGQLVRLSAEDPKVIAKSYALWSRDSEYWRLMDASIARPFSTEAIEKFLEKVWEEMGERNFLFGIRTLAEDQLIGDVELDGVNWAHGEAFVGIALGARELWGKGYGTDAMQVILRFAFQELNLRRLTLNVFEYNPRAVRAYEKIGFKHEGRLRKALYRENRRWDVLYMGILRQEWQELNRE